MKTIKDSDFRAISEQAQHMAEGLACMAQRECFVSRWTGGDQEKSGAETLSPRVSQALSMIRQAQRDVARASHIITMEWADQE